MYSAHAVPATRTTEIRDQDCFGELSDYRDATELVHQPLHIRTTVSAHDLGEFGLLRPSLERHGRGGAQESNSRSLFPVTAVVG